jgi:hypothetical protein
MLKDLKRVAIVAIQTILGADPEKPLAILKNNQAGVLRKPIFAGEVLKLDNAAGGQAQVKR